MNKYTANQPDAIIQQGMLPLYFNADEASKPGCVKSYL